MSIKEFTVKIQVNKDVKLGNTCFPAHADNAHISIEHINDTIEVWVCYNNGVMECDCCMDTELVELFEGDTLHPAYQDFLNAVNNGDITIVR